MSIPFADYYHVLGVPSTAQLHEVKSAFRKLAKIHHPDKKTNTKTTPEQRQEYEHYFRQLIRSYQMIMNQAYTQQLPSKPHSMTTISNTLTLTLPEAWFGVHKVVWIEWSEICSQCDQFDHKKSRTGSTCSLCQGTGTTIQPWPWSIDVPPRSATGQTIQQQLSHDCLVIWTIDVQPFPHWKRINEQLHHTRVVTLIEALADQPIPIQFLDGRIYYLELQEYPLQCYQDYQMAIPDQPHPLLVRFQIQLPTSKVLRQRIQQAFIEHELVERPPASIIIKASSLSD